MTYNTLSRGRRFEVGGLSSPITGTYYPTPPPGMGDLWADKVEANGGARPSANNIAAVNTFWSTLVAAGLDSKMKVVNVFAPDNLTASFTPLTISTGSNPWTNFGFTSASLLQSGLVGNGTSQYLDMGVTPQGVWASNTNFGASYIITSWVNHTPDCAMGSETAGGAYQFSIYPDGAATTYFDGWYNSGTARINGTPGGAQKTGFYSCNRTASNYQAIHYGSEATSSVIQIAVGSNAAGTTPSQKSIFAYALHQDTSNNAVQFSNRRYSFMALHQGLSTTEMNTLMAAVKTMRNSFGGGWV